MGPVMKRAKEAGSVTAARWRREYAISVGHAAIAPAPSSPASDPLAQSGQYQSARQICRGTKRCRLIRGHAVYPVFSLGIA